MPIVLGDTSGLAQGISTAGSALASALEKRAERRLGQQKESKEKSEQAAGVKLLADWSQNYDRTKSPQENIGKLAGIVGSGVAGSSVLAPIVGEMTKKAAAQQGEDYAFNQFFDGSDKRPNTLDTVVPQGEPGSGAETKPEDAIPPHETTNPSKMAKHSNADLVKMAAHPNRGLASAAKAQIEVNKLQQRVDKDERDWHTKFSVEQEKKVAALREAVPKKNSALAHARAAIQSRQTGIMTGTWWAEHTGIEAFRGVEGVQLEVAAKEHFFGNMSRVSAKAQNIFFEKLLKNMFAQVGQTEETGLAFVEILQGELNMDEAYMRAFDRITAEDEQLHGYARKDADRRARQEVEHMEELNLNRTMYRVKQLAEAQESPKEAKANLMNRVAHGTPLTLEKKFMFQDKFQPQTDEEKNDMIREIKRLGYQIPRGGDVHLYSMTNDEFAKKMGIR